MGAGRMSSALHLALEVVCGVGYEARSNGEAPVKERSTTPDAVEVRGLRRITVEEERLRREKIELLRRELAKHRHAARQIEHQLRALGDAEATRSAGWVNWSAVYDELPARFSSREVAAVAGVRPAHVASVLHAWKKQARIAATGKRGQYRKVASGREARTRT